MNCLELKCEALNRSDFGVNKKDLKRRSCKKERLFL